MEGIKGSMLLLLLIQIILIVIAIVFYRYGDNAEPTMFNTGSAEIFKATYPLFQDVHVMIFIGFGFLMTFLHKYGFSSVGFTFLLAAVIIQWAVFCQGLFNLDSIDHKIHIDLLTIANADITAATALISMGACLGRTTPMQLVVMGLIETVIFACNEHLLMHVLQVADAGGSLIVHTFGAYFGLAVSMVLRPPKGEGPDSSTPVSDLFAMIGTVFLWLFWPSFNGILAGAGDGQTRAVINTYFALASCCVTSFALSAVFSKSGKFDMVHIQNATLAGGVAVGASADLMMQPYGALCVGFIAAIVSVAGFRFLTPCLLENLTLHDTCGVHNLHGMPGLLAGIISIPLAAVATEDTYGHSLYSIYPARAPRAGTHRYFELETRYGIDPGDDRSAGSQALFQLIGIGCALGIGILGGIITGYILKATVSYTGSVPDGALFDDALHWEFPEEKSKSEPLRTVENHETIKIVEEKC